MAKQKIISTAAALLLASALIAGAQAQEPQQTRIDARSSVEILVPSNSPAAVPSAMVTSDRGQVVFSIQNETQEPIRAYGIVTAVVNDQGEFKKATGFKKIQDIGVSETITESIDLQADQRVLLALYEIATDDGLWSLDFGEVTAALQSLAAGTELAGPEFRFEPR
jgi:hypothetical protein